jgi:hypothetical protein
MKKGRTLCMKTRMGMYSLLSPPGREKIRRNERRRRGEKGDVSCARKVRFATMELLKILKTKAERN